MTEFGMPTLIENRTLAENITLCKELGLSFIKDIKVGDVVCAYDEISGETEVNTVTEVFERETSVVVEITINGEIIVTTEEHPFYTDSGWVSASMLQTGDCLKQLDGTYAVVEQVVNRSLMGCDCFCQVFRYMDFKQVRKKWNRLIYERKIIIFICA